MRRVVRVGSARRGAVTEATQDDKWYQARQVREDHDEEWQKRLEKAMHYAKGSPLHLTRDERLELARMVPGVSTELESWKELSRGQLDDLINMLEGWVWITWLLDQREEQIDE